MELSSQLAGTVVTAPLNYRESRSWGSDVSLTFESNGPSAYLDFSYAELPAKYISAGAFLADDASEISYIANHWVQMVGQMGAFLCKDVSGRFSPVYRIVAAAIIQRTRPLS